MRQKQLGIFLSKLKQFKDPKAWAEQHPTEPDIAAEVLWFAYMNRDLEDKVVADLGAGTGVLGISALLLGAKKVYFLEKDPDAIKILKENLDLLENIETPTHYEIIQADVLSFDVKVDLILENPPFGTKETHADRDFLEKAVRYGDIIYTFHKQETSEFVEKFIIKHGFKATHHFDFAFPLKNTMPHHKKRIQRIKVGCWRIQRINL